jgi:hypothetical protein
MVLVFLSTKTMLHLKCNVAFFNLFSLIFFSLFRIYIFREVLLGVYFDEVLSFPHFYIEFFCHSAPYS